MDIKVLFSDVDGTLTDGRLYYGPEGEVLKTFHVHDGHGIKEFKKKGIFAIISAKDSQPLRKRISELGITEFALKIDNKVGYLEKWLNEHRLTWANLAYIGDDMNDLPVIQQAGYAGCPADAVKEVQEAVHYVCQKKGGHGAVREFVERLLTLT